MDELASSTAAMYVDVSSQRYPLKTGQIYMFGKDLDIKETCQEFKIIINDEDVDEKHCCVGDSVEEGAYVFDLFSKCGTFLNDNRLRPLEKAFIKHGDVMRLGPTRTLKFHHETSHDSSGYDDNNRNTSDIINSSLESTSQRESRLRRFNSHSTNHSSGDAEKFLVPSVPTAPKITIHSIVNNSINVPETEAISNSRISLGLNSSNQGRHSDSFIVPETQQCKPRTSTSTNLSIAGSDTDEDRTKSGVNFNAFGEDDDDFCIPETQDVLPSSQMPRSLKMGTAMNGLNILEEKSVDLNDSDDNDPTDGSQFRICTQDYNEGFGEENNDSMLTSQIIPLIKHTTLLLNGSDARSTSDKTPQENKQHVEEENKELTDIDWHSLDKQCDEQTKNITSNSLTPDLFDVGALDNPTTDDDGNDCNDNLFEADNPNTLEDEEDYMATQAYPSSSNILNVKGKSTKEKDILSNKDNEQFLTLSDKENLHPDRLELITGVPPTQLFEANDVPTTTASACTKNDDLNKSEAKENQIVPPQLNSPSKTTNKNTKNSLLLQQTLVDEEDEILTQAFLQPSKTTTSKAEALMDEEDDILTQAFLQPSKTTTTKAMSNNCFNSTLLDDKVMGKNPVCFFEEMEKSPKKSSFVNVFKLPEMGYSTLRKSSSAASTTSNATMCSESDMDLLMRTPQLIKDLQFSKPGDLKKSILAAKNRKLFGDDTDDSEDNEDDCSSKDKYLVQLLNVPKDSKDFDKLLPHLKKENHSKSKCTVTEQQRAAKEAYKVHKFNISFGNAQNRQSKSNSESSTKSRDERHSARDREKELAERGPKRNSSFNDDRQQHKNANPNTSKTRNEEAHHQKSVTEKATEARRTRRRVEAEGLTRQKGEMETSGKEKEVPNVPSQKKEKSQSKKKKEDKEANIKSEASNEAKQKEVKAQNLKKEHENKSKKQGKEGKKDIEIDKEEHVEERPRRASKRTLSTESSKETEKKLRKHKDTEHEIQAPTRRMTRLKSVTEEKEKAAKKLAPLAVSEELHFIPSKPLRRNTRAYSTSKQKDLNDDAFSSASSSTAVSYSSSANRSLNRSSSRLSVSNNAFENESTAKTTANKTTSSSLAAAERKRKAEVPVSIQSNAEEKRLKRTISQESSISSMSSSRPARCLISTTMVDPLKLKEIAAKSNGLWAIAKDPSESEILVMDKAFRTFKFLLAIARGIPIVTSEWLLQINATRSLKNTPIKDYLFSDPAFEKRHKFCLKKSLQLAMGKNKRLFDGYEFVTTPNIEPKPEEIKAIIESAGGTVHMQGLPPAKDNQQIYLVSCADDRKDWHKFRRLNKNIIAISTEAIMTSVMRHSCTPLSNHMLS